MTTPLTRYVDFSSDSGRWELYEPRSSDIIISTPPKSGTTLMQMMCAVLIFDSPDFLAPMDAMSPWFDSLRRSDDEVLSLVAAQPHRRFLKTHTPLDGVPTADGVTYLTVARDPRDVFVSWQHHTANLDVDRFVATLEGAGNLERALQHVPAEEPESIQDRFDGWLVDESQPSSLTRIVRHVEASWARRHNPNVHLFHFDDLRRSIRDGLAAVATALGQDETGSRLDELATYATLTSMRERGAELAPDSSGIFTDPALFFRSGGGGEWREFLSTEQQEAYWRRVDELMSPNVNAWIHRT
jgi:aryl sulfotransferase